MGPPIMLPASAIGGRCRTQGGGPLNAKVLQHRAKGTGGAVTAHHGDGVGAKAHQRLIRITLDSPTAKVLGQNQAQ